MTEMEWLAKPKLLVIWCFAHGVPMLCQRSSAVSHGRPSVPGSKCPSASLEAQGRVAQPGVEMPRPLPTHG